MVKKVDVKVRVKVVMDELKKQLKDPKIRRRIANNINGASTTFPKPPPDDTRKIVNDIARPELATVIAKQVRDKPLPLQYKEIPKLTKDIQVIVKKTPWYKDTDSIFKAVVLIFLIIHSLKTLTKTPSSPRPIGLQQRNRSPTKSPPPSGSSPSQHVSPNKNKQTHVTRGELNEMNKKMERMLLTILPRISNKQITNKELEEIKNFFRIGGGGGSSK